MFKPILRILRCWCQKILHAWPGGRKACAGRGWPAEAPIAAGVAPTSTHDGIFRTDLCSLPYIQPPSTTHSLVNLPGAGLVVAHS